MKIMITIFLTIVLMSCKDNKIAYVENAKVFEEFNATIDMKARNESIIKDRKLRLDSLSINIYKTENLLNDSKLSGAIKEKLVPQYVYQKSLYDSLAINLRQLIDELEYNTVSKSWTEINKYIKQYGDENQYQMIHGVSGSGNLMYANEALNITDAVIDYINNQYEGE